MTADVKRRYKKVGNKKSNPKKDKTKDTTLNPEFTKDELKRLPSFYKKHWSYLKRITRANVINKIKRVENLHSKKDKK